MANSIKTYVWNSSTHSNTSDFIAPTPISGRGSTDIKVKVGSTILTSGYTLTVDSSNVAKVRFQTLPNNGDPIRIYRETKHDGRLVDFVDGSLLTSETLDLDSTQLFNMAQEAYDKSEETTIGRESFYYSQGTDPTSDAANIVNTGALWYDTSSSTNTLQVWSGTEWQATAPAKVKKAYQRVNMVGFLQVVNDAHSAGKTKFADTAFKTHSSLYLNGVKLVEASTLADIPTKGDYFLSGGDVILLNLSSDTDVLVSETFDGSFSSSVTASEANAAASQQAAAQSAAGAVQNSQAAGDYKDEAKDARDDAQKYADTAKDTPFTTSSGTSGQLSAKHYAETAADSATTASSAANNTQVQTVGTDLAFGNNSKIKKVSDDIVKVSNVSDKLSEVEAVSLKLNEIDTLSPTSVLNDIGTVAGKASEIGTLAGVAPAISTVSNMVSADITKVADIDDKVTAVANIDQKVVDVHGKLNQINTLTTGDNLDKIEDVADDINDVRTVASLEQDINTLAAASYKGVIETVAETNYKQKVEALAEGAYKLKVETATSPEYKTDIETVADSTFKAEIGTVAGAVSEVKNLSASSGNMATLVSKLGQTTDLAGAVTDAQNSATSASSSASTATTQATTASGHASTAATHAANLGSVAYQNLTAIAESKSVTAVDVFVYDTSKDSDGGAWRNRTQGTSWYNEPLNTSSRGATKKFPAVAVIVTDGDELIIYDGDDPAMPMWFTHSIGGGVRFATDGYGFDISTLTARDGKIFTGLQQEGTSELGVYGGVIVFDYVADTTEKYAGRGSGSNRGVRDGVRFTAWGGHMNIVENDNKLADGEVNDVAVKILPNAPIDPNNGLPVPTIAVATRLGVSVIKDNGNVVDITGQSQGIGKITFTKDNKIACHYNFASELALYDITEADQTFTDRLVEYYPYTNGTAGLHPRILTGSFKGLAQLKDDFAIGSGSGLCQISGLGEKDNALINYITSSYNTGWMNGDIKLATLMDTTAETISAPELVTNGDFSSFGSDLVSNGDFSNGTTDWTVGNTSTPLSVNNGRLRVTEDGAQYTARAIQILACEVGKSYRVSFDIYPDVATGSSGKVYISESSSLAQDAIVNNSGTYSSSATGQSFCFTATTTSPGVIVIAQSNLQSGDFCEYDNIKVEEITGWTATNGELEVTNGQITHTNNGLNGNISQILTGLTTGKTYIVSFDLVSEVGNGLAYVSLGGHQLTTVGSYQVGTHSYSVTLTNSSQELRFSTYANPSQSFTIDNVSVIEAEPDRSVSGNGLNIVGNVTKDNVASGAELVGYAYATDANKLQMPNVADIGAPEYDYCWMWWQKGADFLFGTSQVSQWQTGVGYNPTTGGYFFSCGGSTGAKQLKINHVSTALAQNSVIVGTSGLDNRINTDNFNHFCVVKRGADLYTYINGQLDYSNLNNPFIDDIETTQGDKFTLHSSGGSNARVSLFRISATAPTAEQIAKIYRDEKPLFQEGAKCTLYGNSDGVNGISYDDDTGITHVGTSSHLGTGGLSEFTGLQRTGLNSNTTSVGYAVSAQNGLVVSE